MDRKKVIKGLECCMKWTGEPDTATCHCSDCSYTNMDILGQRCLIDLINDALALLKEQEAVVRCKDCRWSEYQMRYNATTGVRKKGLYCRKEHTFHDDDWYCPKGKQKVGEVVV